MTMPTISVTMAVCNVERFLAASIESVLQQTFTDFEFVIVDFGSTDRSKAIVAAYMAKDDRIKFHEVLGIGLVGARNAACSYARGRYIAVMDADDVCLPERLLLEFEFMEKNQSVGLVGGAAEWIDAGGKSLGIHEGPNKDCDIRLALIDHCPFCHPTVLIRKDALDLVGGYRSAFSVSHDYDMELRLAEHFQLANLKQVVLRYRVHGSQISLRRQREQTLCKLAAQASVLFRKGGWQDPFDAVSHITPMLLARFGVSEAEQEQHFVNEYRMWIRNMCMAGEQSVALFALIEMLKSSDWKYAKKWQIADLWLLAGKLYWKRGHFWRSCLAAYHAFTVSPRVLGRSLRPLMRTLLPRSPSEAGS